MFLHKVALKEPHTTIQQVTCSSFSRSREWSDKFCFWEATQQQHRHSCLSMLSSGPPRHFANLMNLGECLPLLHSVVQTQLLLEGLGKKPGLNAGPYGCCLSPSTHHLHSFLHLTHLVYVCISSKHHSVYVKCKPLCLEKLTCFYFTPLWLRLYTSGTERKHIFQTLWILFCFIGTSTLEKNIAWYSKCNFYCSRTVMLQWRTICSTSILSKSQNCPFTIYSFLSCFCPLISPR